MKKQKAQKTHWMQTNTPEQNKKLRQKIFRLALIGFGSLVMSVGSFLLLSIPNMSPALMMASIMSGVSFLAVHTNSARRASNLHKDLKAELDIQKCLNKSVDKLSKKELELYNMLYPKPQIVHIEHREPRKKIDLEDYYNDIGIIES